MTVARSLSGYPFQPRMTQDQYNEMEASMKKAFEKMEGDYSGNYYSLKDISIKVKETLQGMDAMFDNKDQELQSASLHNRWPHGRGIFASHLKFLNIWLNHSEHLVLKVRQIGGDFKKIYDYFLESLERLELAISPMEFVHHSKLGFVTTSLDNLGTGLKVTVRLEIKNINVETMKKVCDKHYLEFEAVQDKNNTYDVANHRGFGLTEREILKHVMNGVSQLIKANHGPNDNSNTE